MSTDILLSQCGRLELLESEHRSRLGTLVGLVQLLADSRFLGTESISLIDVDEDWAGGVHWLAVLLSFSGKLSNNLTIFFRNCAL